MAVATSSGEVVRFDDGEVSLPGLEVFFLRDVVPDPDIRFRFENIAGVRIWKGLILLLVKVDSIGWKRKQEEGFYPNS